MIAWEWTSRYQAKLEIRKGDFDITFKIGANSNGGWWATARLGDGIYCRSPDVFMLPEDAAKGAIKAAHDALASAVSDVNNVPTELPPRPEVAP